MSDDLQGKLYDYNTTLTRLPKFNERIPLATSTITIDGTTAYIAFKLDTVSRVDVFKFTSNKPLNVTIKYVRKGGTELEAVSSSFQYLMSLANFNLLSASFG